MKKFKKNIIFSIATILTLTAILVYVKFDWWLFGSFSEFKLWYSKFGILIWLFKTLFIIVSGIASILIAQKILFFSFIGLNNIPKHIKISLILFCTYLILAPFFDGNHPFSTFSMYNSLPNWAYNFRLENKQGELIPFQQISKFTSTDATDLYGAFMHKKHIDYGFGKESKKNLTEVGDYMLNELIDEDKLAISKLKDIYLTRIHLFVKDDRIIQQKDTISEKHY